MDRNVLLTALVVVAVVLAGCASTTGPGLTDEAGTTLTNDGADGGTADDGATSQQATVNFYVSDAPIDDFAHLNVTVTKVGFQYAGEPGADEEEDDEGESGDDGNETATPDPNTTTSPGTETPGETTASPLSTTQVDGDEADGEDGKGEGEEKDDDSDDNDSDDEEGDDKESNDGEAGDNDSDDGEAGDVGDDEERDGEAGDVGDDEERDGESGGWIERDVEDRTVDLTELTGPNASLIDSPQLPAGKYTKVFVYVSDVEGVLDDGSTVNVKLPSERLHLNTPFEVGPNESVDFVFDISIHRAGKSGKYILKPVASASGVDQPIEPVGGPDDEAAETGNRDDEADGDGGPPGDGGDGGDGGPPEDGGDDGDGGPPENDGDGDDADEADEHTTPTTTASTEG